MTSSQVLQGVHKLLYAESKKSELLFELCVKHDLLDLHLDGGSFLRRQSFEGRDVAQEKQLVLVEGLLLVFLRRAVEVAGAGQSGRQLQSRRQTGQQQLGHWFDDGQRVERTLGL